MNKEVNLVLGSGAARGLAHIGVIRALEAEGYVIRSIVGCSIGALIGGFYAAGKLEAYTDWVKELSELDVLRFLDISLNNSPGMMKGDKLMNELKELIGEHKIEELSIPFTAVATNLDRQSEVWLNRGDLFDAIRASIAVPGIFTPHMHNNVMLVDGGLLNPLPVTPSTHENDHMNIAVSLCGHERKEPLGKIITSEKPTKITQFRGRIEGFLAQVSDALGIESDEPSRRHQSISDVLLGSFDTMQAAITRFRLAAYPPDILIDIPINICEPYEFYKASQLIESGEYWTRKYLAQYEALQED